MADLIQGLMRRKKLFGLLLLVLAALVWFGLISLPIAVTFSTQVIVVIVAAFGLYLLVIKGKQKRRWQA